VNVVKISAVDTKQYSAASQFAFDQICELAKAQGGDSLVAISHAHLVASYWSGESQLLLLQKLVESNGRFRVRTTTNASSACMKLSGVSDEFNVAQANQVSDLLRQLGAELSFTCAPYHLNVTPAYRDCIAWGESNAVVYANSVIGARTAKTPQFVDLMAALCGYVPYTGLYTDEGRAPIRVVNIEPELLRDDVDYQLLGLWLGETLLDKTPLIISDATPTNDQLRGMGANASTTGNIAMFHWLGITPDADKYQNRAASLAAVDYSANDRGVMEQRYTGVDRAQISAICIGTPHASYEEVERFISPFMAANTHAVKPVFISTSSFVFDRVSKHYDLDLLKSRGVTMVVDSCTYYPTALALQLSSVVATSSGKWAHYARSNLMVDTAIFTIEQLVELATLQTLTVTATDKGHIDD